MPRPTTYRPEQAAAILEDIAAGKTIEAACRRAGIRRTTFLGQVARHGLISQLALVKAGKLSEELKNSAAQKKRKSTQNAKISACSAAKKLGGASRTGAAGSDRRVHMDGQRRRFRCGSRDHRGNRGRASGGISPLWVARVMAKGNPRGRPSKFDPERAARVIARMMEGDDVKSAARAEGVKPSTLRGWAARDVGGFCADYEKAQTMLALLREDEAFSIIEAGGRRARREANWRLRFADHWLRARAILGNPEKHLDSK